MEKKIELSASIRVCSLPPTSEAVTENIKRAHYQVSYWLTALTGKPPDLKATEFGWEQDGPVFIPRTVPAG